MMPEKEEVVEAIVHPLQTAVVLDHRSANNSQTL
jgi:hypothetical protein